MTVEFPRWTQIRELLSLLAELREIREPLTSEVSLRQSLHLLLRLGEMVGVDPIWTGKLRAILDEPGVFAIVLAIVQYALGAPAQRTTDGAIYMAAANGEVVLQAADFARWLPLVIQLIQLLRELRAMTTANVADCGPFSATAVRSHG